VFTRKQNPEQKTWRGGERRQDAPRVAGWTSRYLVDDPDTDRPYVSDSDYTECFVRDLSTTGVGLHSSGGELAVGDRVLLDLRLGARHGASIRVTGWSSPGGTATTARQPGRPSASRASAAAGTASRSMPVEQTTTIG